jgi:hypothetical protein
LSGFNRFAYRDKKVVGVFVRFRAPSLKGIADCILNGSPMRIVTCVNFIRETRSAPASVHHL